jgi:hypothetical protein
MEFTQIAGTAALAGVALGLFVWLMWSFVENLIVYLQSKPSPKPATPSASDDAAKKKEAPAKKTKK